MTRVALYARYSDAKQNPQSVSDQLVTLVRYAEAQGWTVVGSFSDAAISGAAAANRPGLQAALAAADRGEFEVLLTEDEDRLARSLEHLAHVVNRMKRVGGWVATLSTPRVETINVALKGFVGEDFLSNLGMKTRRGVRENAEKGLATGGALYGYRTQPGGAIAIHDEEAAVIRWVFERYIDGETARGIAAQLNTQGVPGPRGGMWNASSIHGSRQRGNGILRTELYAGVKVWNRMEVIKDTFTGRRIPTMKPESEWKRTPVPHLRIIDEATWEQAQRRKAELSDGHPAHNQPRKAGIFSGLLKCGKCGASYTASGAGRLTCAGNRERGEAACDNTRSLNRSEVEERVLLGLKTRLLRPELVAAYVQAYREEFAAQRAADRAERGQIETRLGEIVRSEARTIDAIERGSATPAMEARMMERHAERQVLEARLKRIDEEELVIELHPGAVRAYADQVERLQDYLAGAATRSAKEVADARLVASVRQLTDKIVITPLLNRKGTPYDVTLHGRLSLFLKTEQDELPPTRWGGAMVAGGSCTHAPPSGPRFVLAA